MTSSTVGVSSHFKSENTSAEWPTQPFGRLAALAIRGYQKYLSPYKGYCCAYRVQTGRSSCSEYARRLALRRGIAALWVALPIQFDRCRKSAVALAHQAALASNGWEAEERGRHDARRRARDNRIDRERAAVKRKGRPDGDCTDCCVPNSCDLLPRGRSSSGCTPDLGGIDPCPKGLDCPLSCDLSF